MDNEKFCFQTTSLSNFVVWDRDSNHIRAGLVLPFFLNPQSMKVEAGDDCARISSYCSPGVPREIGLWSGRHGAAPGRDLLLHIAIRSTAELRLRIESTSN